MNILDENIGDEQREMLRHAGLPVRHVGHDISRKGLKDDEMTPFLRRLQRPTFFTLDIDYYKRRLCDAHYCLVYLVIPPSEVPSFVRLVLRHPAFNTQAKRMGCVIRASTEGLKVWRLHAEKEENVTWVA